MELVERRELPELRVTSDLLDATVTTVVTVCLVSTEPPAPPVLKARRALKDRPAPTERSERPAHRDLRAIVVHLVRRVCAARLASTEPLEQRAMLERPELPVPRAQLERLVLPVLPELLVQPEARVMSELTAQRERPVQLEQRVLRDRPDLPEPTVRPVPRATRARRAIEGPTERPVLPARPDPREPPVRLAHRDRKAIAAIRARRVCAVTPESRANQPTTRTNAW